MGVKLCDRLKDNDGISAMKLFFNFCEESNLEPVLIEFVTINFLLGFGISENSAKLHGKIS